MTRRRAGRVKSKELAELLQCGFIEREGKLTDTVVTVAQELGVQHVVVGEAAHPGVRGRLHRGLVDRLITELPDVSVHVVARPASAESRRSTRRGRATGLRGAPARPACERHTLGPARLSRVRSRLRDDGGHARRSEPASPARHRCRRRRGENRRAQSMRGRARRPRSTRRSEFAGARRSCRRGRPAYGATRRSRASMTSPASTRREGRSPNRCRDCSAPA